MVSMHIIIQLNFTERNKKYINLKSFDRAYSLITKTRSTFQSSCNKVGFEIFVFIKT